jgi:hypothetical protein
MDAKDEQPPAAVEAKEDKAVEANGLSAMDAISRETVDLVLMLLNFCCSSSSSSSSLMFVASQTSSPNRGLQEHIPVEEVFEHLKCTKEGLTSEGAQQRVDIFGYNKLEEKRVCTCLLIIMRFTS